MAGKIKGNRISLGQHGEDLAVAYLTRQGYEIVARNWRTRAGELDIVARDGEWLVFVEVRTRRRSGRSQTPSLGTPEESVTLAKQTRLVAMAERYLFEHPWNGRFRIDLIALEIHPNGSVARLNHLQDAVEGIA